jgi:hypothetical protein
MKTEFGSRLPQRSLQFIYPALSRSLHPQEPCAGCISAKGERGRLLTLNVPIAKRCLLPRTVRLGSGNLRMPSAGSFQGVFALSWKGGEIDSHNSRFMRILDLCSNPNSTSVRST